VGIPDPVRVRENRPSFGGLKADQYYYELLGVCYKAGSLKNMSQRNPFPKPSKHNFILRVICLSPVFIERDNVGLEILEVCKRG
jgi:hypothetical protein